MNDARTSKKRVIDYLDHPPQRWDIAPGLGGSVDFNADPTGEWVKFEEMDLYMLEGGELMKKAAAELDVLREVARLALELCVAVDRAEEDIGGSRPTLMILQELGPACEAWERCK